MALVHVEHLGTGQAPQFGERTDGAHSADTGQDLLPDAVLLIAAVQPVGDGAHVVIVLRDVGVEQQQRDPPHLGDPDPRRERHVVGQRELDQDCFPVGVGEQTQRQPLRIQRRIVFVLPPVGGQRLPKVARAVVQADGDQRQTQIGGRLEMVTGEDAQPAGIVGQHLGDAELHREVGDAVRQRHRRCVSVADLRGTLLVPQRTGQIVLQVCVQRLDTLDERRVGGQLLEALGTDVAEHCHRVASGVLPEVVVDGLEQVLRRLVPGPAQVRGQPLERGQPFGQMSADGEPAKGFHACHLTGDRQTRHASRGRRRSGDRSLPLRPPRD